MAEDRNIRDDEDRLPEADEDMVGQDVDELEDLEDLEEAEEREEE